jgi:hypothetical protein
MNIGLLIDCENAKAFRGELVPQDPGSGGAWLAVCDLLKSPGESLLWHGPYSMKLEDTGNA